MDSIRMPSAPSAQSVESAAQAPVKGYALNGGKTTAAKMDAAAKEFESHFVSQMVSTMFSTVEPNEALGGGDAEEIYQSMLTNEYGKLLARTGGVGVAEQVKQIMLSQQEVE